MKVALYARVSRADKDQRPENQLIKLRDYASRHEFTVYMEYVDYASGATPERPALKRMLVDARGNRFSVIAVTRVDRIGRSVANFANLIAELDANHVALVTTDQPINTSSSTGRFLRTVLSAFAELELELIRERTKDGLARARAEGKVLGRPEDLELTARLLTLHTQRLTHGEIGRELGLSEGAVKQRLRRVRIREAKLAERPGEIKGGLPEGATQTDDSVTGNRRPSPR